MVSVIVHLWEGLYEREYIIVEWFGKCTPLAVAESAAVAATLSAEDAIDAPYESALEAIDAAAEVYGLAMVAPN